VLAMRIGKDHQPDHGTGGVPSLSQAGGRSRHGLRWTCFRSADAVGAVPEECGVEAVVDDKTWSNMKCTDRCSRGMNQRKQSTLKHVRSRPSSFAPNVANCGPVLNVHGPSFSGSSIRGPATTRTRFTTTTTATWNAFGTHSI
jgi:hypothetical protein